MRFCDPEFPASSALGAGADAASLGRPDVRISALFAREGQRDETFGQTNPHDARRKPASAARSG